METSLFAFVLHVAITGFASIAQDFGEDILEGVVANGTPLRLVGRRDSMIASVGNVEGGAQTMTTLIGSINIYAAQANNILLGTQDAGDDDGVQGYLLNSQRIQKTAADMLEQHARTRDKIRYAALHTRVDAIEWIVAHIDQLVLAGLGLLAIVYRPNAIAQGCLHLYILQVVETCIVGMNTTKAVFVGEIERCGCREQRRDLRRDIFGNKSLDCLDRFRGIINRRCSCRNGGVDHKTYDKKDADDDDDEMQEDGLFKSLHRSGYVFSAQR